LRRAASPCGWTALRLGVEFQLNSPPVWLRPFPAAFQKYFIQISRLWCLSNETVTGPEQSAWCGSLFEAKAVELILYGRALGLSHDETDDCFGKISGRQAMQSGGF
jgi:hypothetical protein